MINKRLLAVILAVLACLLISCSSGGQKNETTDTKQADADTTEITLPPTTDDLIKLTPMDVLEFVSDYDGTWTSEGNALIDIFSEDGNGYIYFAKWDAGGDFPCGKITELKKDRKGAIYATLYVPEIIGDEFMEGRDAYTIDCILEITDGSASVEIDGKTTVYTYDPNRQL